MRHFFLLIFLLCIVGRTNAANYYWRVTPVNNLFTNLGNWETSPGSGVSPATAPTIADDVFFPSGTTSTSISFNGGSCRDFNYASTTSCVFNGTLTAIAGSLNCNGNASFGIVGSSVTALTMNFTGSGARTIQIGTTANRVYGTLNFTASTGSYTLSGAFNTFGNFTVSGPSFSTAGNDFTFAGFIVSGSTAKTINFSNSLVTCIRNSSTGASSFTTGITVFNSSSSTTTYTFTNTRLVLQNDFTTGTGDNYMLQLGSSVSVSMDSLIINSSTSGIDRTILDFQGTLAAPSVLTANVMRVNTGNLVIGANGAVHYAPMAKYDTLKIAKLVFSRSATCYNNENTVLNIGSGGIVETTGCGKVVFMNNMGNLRLNTSAALTTSNTDYYGVIFGGSGLTASTSSNIGLNSGAVTWTAASSGTNFWWVGGTGNWNDPTKWSIISSGGTPQSSSGCLPTLNDDVFFDANSFTANQTVTIPNGYDAMCKNLDWSVGSNRGLLSGPNNSFTYGNGLIINGNANFTKARGINASLMFVGSGTHTITSGTFFRFGSYYVRLQGSGTYTLADDFLADSTGSCIFQHRAGTFNTNGFKVDANYFFTTSLPLRAANTRTLNIANSDIIIRGGNFNFGLSTAYPFLDVSFLSALNATNSNIKYYAYGFPYFAITRNDSTAYLANVKLNNVSFASGSASYQILNNSGTVGYTTSINDMSFISGGASIQNNPNFGDTVNTYTFSAGNTYTFQSGKTFYITTGINTALSGCAFFVLINSNTTGAQAFLRNKSLSSFIVNGAFVQGINSVDSPLRVTSGVDGGGNTNVVIGAATGRTMYWVAGTGNWSDGAGHWSIGVSGGSPAVTNPLGCIPRMIDSVVFDNNSFSTANQTVTIDANAFCKGMTWTSAVSSLTPRLAGANSYTLYNYGSLLFATGMTCPFAGSMSFRGSNTNPGSTPISFKGVTLSGFGVVFEGGGYYDLMDSIRTTYFQSNVSLAAGSSLNTNGNKIQAQFVNFNAASGCTLNMSNSTIVSNLVGPYTAVSVVLNSGSTFSGSGCTTYTNDNASFTNNTGSPTNFGSVIFTGSTPSQNALTTAPVSTIANFSKIQFSNTTVSGNGNSLNGQIVTDTLQYAQGVTNSLTPGSTRSYTVKDTLIAYGTPCSFALINSTTAGTQAILKSTKCNINLNFVNIKDINVSTCTAAQNKTIGNDQGDNTNWTFTTLAVLTKLGNDTSITCKYIPYPQSTLGFGSIPGMTYLWGAGETSSTLSVDSSNTYSVAVTYASGCVLTDTRILNVIPFPPVVLASGNEQKSPNNCLKNGYYYYEGAAASHSFDTAILAIKPNGNSFVADSVKVNNKGNLVGTGSGTFSNTGTGYYQSTDGSLNTVRVSKRLHTVSAPGTYYVGGGVVVRVYYTAADTAAMLTDAWPGGASTAYKGWFKHKKHNAQDVVNDMTPGNLAGSIPVTPIAYGTENGVRYAEFMVNTFSTFGFVSATTAVPLPIKLLNFSAVKNNSNALLNWQTGVEQNSDYFEIEHSSNGSDWQFLGKVYTRGSNSTYSYTHNNPANGLNMYRLKMVDKDGTLSYSPVRTLNFDGMNNNSWSIYPNPASETINFDGLSNSMELRIVNMIGREVLKTTVAPQYNTINVSTLPKGIYLLQAEGYSAVKLELR